MKKEFCSNCNNIFECDMSNNYPPLCDVCKNILNTNINRNIWVPLKNVTKVLDEIKNNPEWSWARNSTCKYIEIKIDMRTQDCIIFNRENKKILPNQIKYQYKECEE